MDLDTKNYFKNKINVNNIEDMKIFNRISKSLQKNSFLKTHFKIETIEKYKNACGNYFGI